MKKLVLSLACLSAFGLAGGAAAEPPHGKASLLHCGCVIDANNNVGMAYVPVNVSSKAKGHVNHAAGTVDSCVDATGTLVDFTRTGSDCQVSGATLEGVAQCADQAANASCGEQVAQQ